MIQLQSHFQGSGSILKLVATGGSSKYRFCAVPVLALAALGMAGCGGAVALSANFPSPMIGRLPLTAQVQYPASLREFTHIEEAMDTTRWTIDLGQPSVRMLNAVFSASLNLVPPNAAGAAPDLIIEPEILRFEFGVPGRSKIDVPAAWIEFDVRITSANGAPLTSLKIPGYGEGSRKSRGLGKSLSEAAEYALRDAGATLTREITQDAAILALIGSDS